MRDHKQPQETDDMENKIKTKCEIAEIAEKRSNDGIEVSELRGWDLLHCGLDESELFDLIERQILHGERLKVPVSAQITTTGASERKVHAHRLHNEEHVKRNNHPHQTE